MPAWHRPGIRWGIRSGTRSGISLGIGLGIRSDIRSGIGLGIGLRISSGIGLGGSTMDREMDQGTDKAKDKGQAIHSGPAVRPLLPAPVWAVLAAALAVITAWMVFFAPPGAPSQDFAGDVPGLDEDLFDRPSGAPDTAAQLARLREMVSPEQRAMANPVEPTPQALDRARSIFGSQCAVCHGPQGDANVPVARTLNPPPVNFTHPAFAEMEPGATFAIIKNGSPGTGMPGFGQSYSDEEIWALVHFLHLNFTAVPRRTEDVQPPMNP